ncbi:MAG: hypothetical protein ACTHL3_05980 [Candidatus Nitrosocosmicus sp.]
MSLGEKYRPSSIFTTTTTTAIAITKENINKVLTSNRITVLPDNLYLFYL